MLRAFLRVKNGPFMSRRCANAAHIDHKSAKEGIPSIKPILDFSRRLTNPKRLENSIARRNQSSQHNIEDLVAQWKIYDSVLSKRRTLENEQEATSKLLKEAKKTKQKDLTRKYTLELETIREDLHNLKQNLDGFEETLIDQFLSLPNDIHSATPDEPQIIYSHKSKLSPEKRIHHLDCSEFVEYISETNYYLKGDAAKFEFVFANYCLDHFRGQHFIHFSNPDFVQTPILEAVGMTGDGFYEIYEKSDDPTKLIHLVGNGSMHAFMGFITRLRVYKTLFPLQWVATGQIYTHRPENNFDLYDVCQSNVVQVFQAGIEKQMYEKFDQTLKLVCNLFETLDIHFRVAYVPSKELGQAESLVARIEMFSPYRGQYVEVGNLSYYGDYISKRLLFSYVKDKETKSIDFPHIISGTICNLNRIVAVILETHNGIIPSNLLKFK